MEAYLDILPSKLRKHLTKLRLSSHKLPIEKGRWNNTPRNDRICPDCPNRQIGDEFHYLFECSKFNTERIKYLDAKYRRHPSVYKSSSLFSSTNKNTLVKLSKFVEIILEQHE